MKHAAIFLFGALLIGAGCSQPGQSDEELLERKFHKLSAAEAIDLITNLPEAQSWMDNLQTENAADIEPMGYTYGKPMDLTERGVPSGYWHVALAEDHHGFTTVWQRFAVDAYDGSIFVIEEGTGNYFPLSHWRAIRALF